MNYTLRHTRKILYLFRKIMHRYLVTFSLLLSVVRFQVDGVRCYVCQSVSNPACGDIFTLSEQSKDFVGNCRTSCYTFTAIRGDNRDISRGCLPSIKIIPQCKTDTIGDMHGTFCACNKDFCNGVLEVRADSLTNILVILVFTLLRTM